MKNKRPKFDRGPHGMEEFELGQDRNVAALRMYFMPWDNLRSFISKMSIPKLVFSLFVL